MTRTFHCKRLLYFWGLKTLNFLDVLTVTCFMRLLKCKRRLWGSKGLCREEAVSVCVMIAQLLITHWQYTARESHPVSLQCNLVVDSTLHRLCCGMLRWLISKRSQTRGAKQLHGLIISNWMYYEMFSEVQMCWSVRWFTNMQLLHTTD